MGTESRHRRLSRGKKPKPKGLGSLLGPIKEAVPTLGAAGAISYAAGFVVVTSNLLRRGINDITLVNARYVSVGLLFLLLTALAVVPPYYWVPFMVRRVLGQNETHQPSPSPAAKGRRPSTPASEPPQAAAPTPSVVADQPARVTGQTSVPHLTTADELLALTLKLKRQTSWPYPAVGAVQTVTNPSGLWGQLLMVALLVSAAAPVSVIVLSSSTTWLFQDDALRNIWAQYGAAFDALFPGWYLPLVVARALAYAIVHDLARGDWILGIPNRYWLTGVIVGCALVATRNYALAVYPRLAPALGGGDFVAVELVPAKEAEDTVNRLLGGAPRWLCLLDQNDKAYFVVFTTAQDGDHAVQVDKSLVKGIVYPPNLGSCWKPWAS